MKRHTMSKVLLAATVAALSLALGACGSAGGPAAAGKVEGKYESDAAQGAASAGILGAFSTVDVNGNAASQDILAGHELTMVNVWATYCGPCLSEMPDLGELAAEYEGTGVQIVGLVTDVLNSDGSVSDKQLQTARDVAESTGAGYLHLVPSPDLFGLLSQIPSVPTTFFVDEHGNQMGSVYVGARSKADWAAIVEATLAESA